ncbi:MAG: hypothetical protein PF689_05295 [Deltaproteobacteria bacterium]|nr:hypothetical protein [Deltaproteobacteria bacterium]
MNKLFILLITLISISGCNKFDSKEKSKQTDELKKAKVLLRQGEYGAAMDRLEKLKSKYNNNKVFWNTYGMVLRYNAYLDLDPSLRQKEISAFKKAVEFDREFIPARMNLAVSLWETGNRNEATIHYQKVLDLNPSHKDAKTIRNRIKLINTQNSPKDNSDKKKTP